MSVLYAVKVGVFNKRGDRSFLRLGWAEKTVVSSGQREERGVLTQVREGRESFIVIRKSRSEFSDVFARMVSPGRKSRSEVSDVCLHDGSADLCPDSGQDGRYVFMRPPL